MMNMNDKLTNEKSRIPVSDEENYFYWWLLEAQQHGLVEDFIYQPDPFVYPAIVVERKTFAGIDSKGKEKYKTEKFYYMKEKKVTLDFLVIWSPIAMGYLCNLLGDENFNENALFIAQIDESGQYFSYVEIKPEYDLTKMTRLAISDRVWIYEKFKIMTNIIFPVSSVDKYGKVKKPEALYIKTWTPARYMIQNNTPRARKIGFPVRTVEEFFNQ